MPNTLALICIVYGCNGVPTICQRICDATNLTSGRTYIILRPQPGPGLIQAGLELHPAAILRHGVAPEFYQRSFGPTDFATMSLPIDDSSIGEATAGLDLTPPSDPSLITPPPAAMSRLQRLHAAAGDLAENAPEIIAHPEAARGLEQALIEAMVACLGEGVIGEDRSALRHHATIMRRFRKAVEESPDQPLYIPELCKAIGVSDRTLRVCCQEQLGMSPKRYLLLRRMHLARRTLRDSSPGVTTVTDIATQYGFWQFGRRGIQVALRGSAVGHAPSPARLASIAIAHRNLPIEVRGMPSSAVHIFTDPDDYAASIRGTRAELTVAGRGDFTAKLIRIDLHRLLAQRHAENLPRIVHSANMTGRAMISFRTESGPRLLAGGLEMSSSMIIQHCEAQNYFQQSSGSAYFGTMSAPVEEIIPVGSAIAGCDLTPPDDALILTPPPSAMTKLQRLHAAAGRLAEDAPEIIAHPEAARGLEQALIEAMVRCLSVGKVREDRSAHRHHSQILRRFRRAVEENPDQPFYIPELCAAIGVSDRTLRICCQEQLGMSPKRYLLLRRMHLARRALRDSSPGTTTVTEIATQYGFWQFGRFAGEYKSLFGEAPSATLHRLTRSERAPRSCFRHFCQK